METEIVMSKIYPYASNKRAINYLLDKFVNVNNFSRKKLCELNFYPFYENEILNKNNSIDEILLSKNKTNNLFSNEIMIQILLKKTKLNEIKTIAKNLKIIHSKKNKLELIKTILCLFYYTKIIVFVQKCARRFIINKFNMKKGNALFKRSLCNNETDPISLEPLNEISYYNFFSYKSGDFEYGFDIMSIYNLRKTNKWINPFNREKFPNDVWKKILRIRSFSNKILKHQLSIENEKEDEYLNDEKKLKQRIMDVFSSIDNCLDFNWFFQINENNLTKLINIFQNIWNARELRLATQSIYRGNILNNIHIRIPRNENINLKSHLLKINLIIIERLISNPNEEIKILGGLYAIGALTLVSESFANYRRDLYECFINFQF